VLSALLHLCQVIVISIHKEDSVVYNKSRDIHVHIILNANYPTKKARSESVGLCRLLIPILLDVFTKPSRCKFHTPGEFGCSYMEMKSHNDIVISDFRAGLC